MIYIILSVFWIGYFYGIYIPINYALIMSALLILIYELEIPHKIYAHYFEKR